MNLEQRTGALLELVDRYKVKRCAELIEPARAEAHETVRNAIVEARRRVTTAIAAERKRYAIEVGAVEAALATERRLSAQRHAVQLLAGAWTDLRTRLQARWRAAAQRQRWTRAHLARALHAVPRAGGWRIEYESSWTDMECAQAAEWLRGEGVGAVEFIVRPVTAGFRVIAGHNVFDATLDGLLADRAQLEGRLLHHLSLEES